MITNELIAEKVMQWKVIDYLNGVKDVELPNGEIRKLSSVGNYFDFLNDMNAADLVLQCMSERGFLISIFPYEDEGSFVQIHAGDTLDPICSVRHESLPTAICEAVLKAMEVS